MLAEEGDAENFNKMLKEEGRVARTLPPLSLLIFSFFSFLFSFFLFSFLLLLLFLLLFFSSRQNPGWLQEDCLSTPRQDS